VSAIPPLIHIVDDDPSVLRALKRLLCSWGMRVRAFESGEAFLAALGRSQEADCAVIDIEMPGMNGFDVQAQMNRAGKRVPVIFITAHGEDRLEKHALGSGAAGFLRKPFTEKALVDLIHRALRHSRKPPAGEEDDVDHAT
jgi:FixJ family two-component response regulator